MAVPTNPLAPINVKMCIRDSLSGVLLPFFIAWLIAYMVYPLVKFFQYKPVSYTHLDVYKRQVSNYVYDNRWQKPGDITDVPKFVAGDNSGAETNSCLLYTSRCV